MVIGNMVGSSCPVGVWAIGGLCMSPWWAVLRRWRIPDGVALTRRPQGEVYLSKIPNSKIAVVIATYLNRALILDVAHAGAVVGEWG